MTSVGVAGLTADTAYDVYFVAQDDEGTPNVMTSATKVDVRTTGAADTTPPTFDVAPTAINIGNTSFDFQGSIDEAGKVYYIVVADGEPTPTPANVIAGTDSTATPAIKYGILTIESSPFDISPELSGLTIDTAYDVYFVAQDDESTPNVMASATKVDVKTTAGPDETPPTLTLSSPVDNATDVSVNSNIVLTFSENVVIGEGAIKLYKSSDDSVVTVQFLFDNNYITIVPLGSLEPETGYYILNNYGVADSSDNYYEGLADKTKLNFTTTGGIDTTQPTLTLSSPLDNATNVAVANNIVLTFSEDVGAGGGLITLHKSSDDSVVETFDTTAPAGKITFNDEVVTLNPATDLAYSTGYYLKIEATPIGALLKGYGTPAIVDSNDNQYDGISDKTTLNFTTTSAPDTSGPADPPVVVPPVVVPPNDDQDGISNTVEDSAPGLPPKNGGTTVAGDGNGDGVKDSDQPAVTSLQFRETSTSVSNPGNAPKVFVTLVADSKDGVVNPGSKATITSISQKDAPADLPKDATMPLGLFDFTAKAAAPGSTENFSIFIDGDIKINGYWKQVQSSASTKADTPAKGTWVNLADPVYGGKLITENGKTRLDFTIQDGGIFDDDGKADGTISDPGGPALMVSTNTVPLITSTAIGAVAENAAITTVAYTVTATDTNTDQVLSYSLTGADVAAFNINSSTGAVTLKASADYEAQSAYRINVVASDNAVPSLSATQAVTINVTNTNDAPTISAWPNKAQSVTVGIASSLPDFTVADQDGDALTVTLTPTNGSLGGITDANASLPGVQLTGTASIINTALKAATFTATAVGAASINIGVTDGLATPVKGIYTLTASDGTNTGCPFDPFRMDADKDGAPDAIEALHGMNSQAKDNDVFNVKNNNLFTTQLYRDLLGREGDNDAGVNYWAGQLDGSTITRTEVLGTVLGSAEFDAHAGAVIRLYHAALGHTGDLCGFNYWLGQANAGMDTSEMGRAFLNSAEFGKTQGGLNNAGFVDLMYRNVLHREAETVGRTYWIDQLETNKIDRGGMLYSVVQSKEFKAAMVDDVAVDILYLGLLDRAPSAEETTYWMGQYTKYTSATAFLQAATATSTEYHNRFVPADGTTHAAALVGVLSEEVSA